MSHLSPIQLDRLNQHRQRFPALANKAYFNYGGQGTMPQEAIAAIQQAHNHIQKTGPFSGSSNGWIMEQAKQIKTAIAVELSVPIETLTLTEDVSVGCNIPLWGIDWQPGDHLLLTDCEHPGIIAAAREIQRRFGIEITTCPLMATLNGGDPTDVIAQYLQPTTRLVVLSHVLWNTGQVLPVAEIVQVCHAQPKIVRVLVDAAQSVGMLPLNLTELGADFYAFTGHKWWCGPAGLGGLYVSPDAQASLSPTFIGWRGITVNASGHPLGWMEDGRKFEIATSDYTLYAGLREAIAYHQQWGTAADRYHRLLQLSHSLWQKLSELRHVTCLREASPESGLVSFTVEGQSHPLIVKALEQQGLFVRTILDPDCIRACVHYFTSEKEIEQLVVAIEHVHALNL
ncbi:MAG: aminotransferase class V-fold PLP-dependent enzyme [Timaviella obliquedivisa GSE-PSE-MK23-08B]|jgi:L-cysteine/cystine lyase|nr:aminotransferase class V-fold PLP-dependent enzyme [Timaviella obliquedivisa GSE-PSE-MK23-08B]